MFRALRRLIGSAEGTGHGQTSALRVATLRGWDFAIGRCVAEAEVRAIDKGVRAKLRRSGVPIISEAFVAEKLCKSFAEEAFEETNGIEALPGLGDLGVLGESAYLVFATAIVGTRVHQTADGYVFEAHCYRNDSTPERLQDENDLDYRESLHLFLGTAATREAGVELLVEMVTAFLADPSQLQELSPTSYSVAAGLPVEVQDQLRDWAGFNP